MKRIVIIGATSAIAQACAAQWLARGPAELVLVGRNRERTERTAAAMAAAAPGAQLRVEEVDFHDPAAIAALADALARSPIDIVLIAHGAYPDQDRCQHDLAALDAALAVNAVSPVLFAEAFARHLEAAGRGRIAVIGSLAGDRGRKSNYMYGAAKGLLARYVQGLQHRFAGSAVRAVLIKPGPIDTPMTAQAKAGGTRVAPCGEAARDIVDGIARGRAVVYTPGRWKFIMLALVHLPSFIFNRLDI